MAAVAGRTQLWTGRRCGSSMLTVSSTGDKAGLEPEAQEEGGGVRAGGKCATSGLAGARCIIALSALDAVDTLIRGREQPVDCTCEFR